MSDKAPADRGSVLSTIKWVCIAVAALALAFVAYKAYRLVAAPAEAVGSAAEGLTKAVKSGAGAVTDTTSDIYNRLVIPAPNQQNLDRAAEAAFAALIKVPVSESTGVKDGVIRMRHLGGNGGQVCVLKLDFGAGGIPVFAAADNEAFQTSKSLGAADDRLIRMVILTENDDVAFNAGWDAELKFWKMKWKATTLKKEVGDDIAAARIMEILTAIKTNC